MRRSCSVSRGVLPAALVLSLVLAGCRRTPVPDISGPLGEVVVRAAFEGPDGGAVTQPLMLDAGSFARLGLPVRGAPFTEAELRGQVARPFTLVDPRAVLVCPEREPCHVVDDGVYLEIWQAERRGDAAELVVTRVQNVRGLHVLTRAVTHRLIVAEVPGGWRLTRIERLPT